MFLFTSYMGLWEFLDGNRSTPIARVAHESNGVVNTDIYGNPVFHNLAVTVQVQNNNSSYD